MALLKYGNRAPDIKLMTVEGNAYTLLNEIEHGRHVLLVFLRHLG